MGMTWEEELDTMKTGIVVSAIRLASGRRGYCDGDMRFPQEFADDLLKQVEAFQKRCVEHSLSKEES